MSKDNYYTTTNAYQPDPCLQCYNCDKLVFDCSECQHEFKDNDTIYCNKYGEHLCQECYDKWLNKTIKKEKPK